MTAHPLPPGTWIRSKVTVSDSGDYNDRVAKPGELGLVSGLKKAGDDPSYSVVFWPSHVHNVWSASEIEADAEILPPGHPDIPSPQAVDLASAVADIVADGEVDEDEETVTAPASVRERIVAGAPSAGARADEILGIVGNGSTPDGMALSFEEFDRLAVIVGVGDRLGGRIDPFEAPTP